MKTKRNIIIAASLCSLFAASFIFTNLQAKNTPSSEAEKKIEALSKLTRTMSIIEQYYVDDVNYTDLVDKSIAGLLTNLDAHSSFLNDKDYKELKEQTNGEFGGLGFTITQKDGAISVVAPIEGSPADKAGIKTDDIILRINNESTLGMTLNEAVSKMRGEPKTKVTLTIYRKGENKPFDVNLKRDIIKVDSVYSKTIEGENLLYIRVTNFDKNVVSEVSKAIKKHPKTKGIILDLRTNPGGILNQAVGLVNLFVDKGVIVSQKGKIESENTQFKAIADKKISDAPLVVLVNGGSASASEIVSGALQDFKRAIIVGEKTFGKGSVQLILPMDEKGNEGLRLTIAKYYLPSGRTIQAIGVNPDVEVFPGKVSKEENHGFEIKEADLKKHLQAELDKMGNESKKENKEDKNIINKEQINNDIQLKTAIDTIKILNITKGE
ncbi:S41 family peptidase [Campylobacter insulaenigrae]|uniref:Carboxyl-terminal protease family protein n=1 Tax=Campylobacter insulaenigrae NCTC 12927 TaxID=1031564 RepID=A0A0A8H437_9BACT|nr:carboxyl-terminal protease family protein [Campylobacter insulaenigrae NCTC 12927]VEH93778.1 peptidase, S41 family [Campylobacter insulaenigrae]